MELWIRSQDRETLCKIDDIHIEEQSIYTDTHLKVCLGTYKSKERALEVLDEIQSILVNEWDFKGKFSMCRVYNMPED